jgi:alpha-galactosidase
MSPFPMLTTLFLPMLALPAVAAALPEEVPVARAWAQRAFLGRTDTAPPAPGLELRRQDYDALGLARSSRLGPLQIGQQRYEHGLGTHAISEILVRLPRPGRQFQAEAGVDFGWPGSVAFVVELAGKPVFTSDVRRVDSPPLPVAVDLAGAMEFTLRVTDGGDGPSSDHANWANAAVTLADGTQLWLDELPVRGTGTLADALPFSFVYGGQPAAALLATWARTEAVAEAPAGLQRYTLTYTDPASGLEVACDLTLGVDLPTVEWVLRFRNTGAADTPLLEDIRALDLALAVPPGAAVTLHHSRGSTCQGTDFLPVAAALATPGELSLAPNGGRSSDGVLPFFNLEWERGGIAAAVGWSGQWALRAQRDASNGVRLQAGQQTTHLVLRPGESIRTPRILLALWQGADRQRGHNLLRRALVANYLPKRNGELAIAPTTWNSWFSFNEGNSVDETNQLDWIARTAATGMECYWLDAGWFEGGWPAGAGSWVPDAKRFPRGLRPLGDAAHQAGMKFVLWLEPERVNPNSRLAKEHPEWVLHAGPGDGLLNLGDAAARTWLADHLANCFRDWGVDVFRMDFNIDPLRFWQAADAPDRQGLSEIRHIEGLYALWDELVRRQPGLTIDNCASGGRRIDLETVSRSYPLWRSDTPCVGSKAWPVWDQTQIAGLSLYLPQHTGGVWGLDPYTFRSAATMGVSVCPDLRAQDFPLDLAQRALAEVKELRPLYLGDYYPLFEISPSETVWGGWQFDRPELGQGFAMAFRRPSCPYVSAELRLRGLDPAARYEVQFRAGYETGETRTLSAAELGGLRLEIGTAPGCVLVLYRKTEPLR